MNDLMDEADQGERQGQRHGRVSRQGRRQVAGHSGDDRQPDQGAVLAHRLHEAVCRHRHPGDVSGRRAAQGRQLDARHLPQGGRSLPQGRPSVRHRSRHDVGQRRHDRRDLPLLRRRAGQRQGRDRRQERPGPPGARLLQEADGLPAARRGGVGRRFEQQVPGVGPGLDDHEPAVSAWAVAKRDAPKVAEQCWTHGFPAGPKGRFAPFLPFFWGTWNFSKNQSAAKSLLTLSLAGDRRPRRW